jgi:hypothetical protein
MSKYESGPLKGQEKFDKNVERREGGRVPGVGVPDERKGVNPKDLLGAKKLSLTGMPAVAIALGNAAMADGKAKYGPYNWRDNNVISSVYVDAAMRHMLAWFEGEEVAEDSGVHHLGHAIACLAILVDAQAGKNLSDDRPRRNGAFSKMLKGFDKTKNPQIPAVSSEYTLGYAGGYELKNNRHP